MPVDILQPGAIKQMISEIKGEDEKGRRSEMKKRDEIYRDGGKRFLIEQVRREFAEDAISEMRFAPINLLKKIVNKKSAIYKKAPTRTATPDMNQPLVDFYTEELEIDQRMLKANRYLNLYCNTAIYPVPRDGLMEIMIVPPWLYSISENPINRTKIDTWIFNAFTELNEVLGSNADPAPSTGRQGFSRNKKQESAGDLINSEEFQADNSRRFIFWSDDAHLTTDNDGNPILLDPNKGAEQFVNPIGRAPVVNLAKDRDNSPWAQGGDDLIDLTMAIQLAWSDLLTISKHQGYSILTVVSEEEPKKLTIGVNRAVWLKNRPDGPAPSISYVQANSPLQEYKDLIMDLLGLLLSTNDMDPGAIGGTGSVRNFTSGFQALLAMSDTLEAIQADIPIMRDAERDTWDVIARWHNWQFDNDLLRDDARALGKFTEDFTIDIQYADIKPLESNTERNTEIIQLLNNGLLTKKAAVQRLNPDKSDEDIDALLAEIEEEKQNNVALFSPPVAQESKEEEEENGDQEGELPV